MLCLQFSYNHCRTHESSSITGFLSCDLLWPYEIFVLFFLVLQVLAQKVSYVVVVFQQMGINFAAVCLIIKSLVEMYHQHAVCDGPRMLRTWLIVCCPRGWSDALSPNLHQPNLWLSDECLKFCPSPNLTSFEMWISFQVCGLVLASSQNFFFFFFNSF